MKGQRKTSFHTSDTTHKWRKEQAVLGAQLNERAALDSQSTLYFCKFVP